MKTKITTSLIAASLAAFASLHGQVIYEGFNYTDAEALDGQSGGTGLNAWTETDTGSTVVNPPTNLNTGELQVSGGELTSSPNAEANATISADISANLADDTSLWFSIVLGGDLGGSNFHGGFALGNSILTDTFNGINSSGDAVGVYIKGGFDATSWNGGARDGQSNSGNLALAGGGDGSANLLVGRFDWGAASDTLTLWNVTDLSNIPDEATLTAGTSNTHTTAVNLDQTTFDTISFSYRDNGTPQFTDEIRFGATYGDVSPVPEPSSFALLAGMFGLTWIMLRRRS
jgi:hypothetical protein